MIVKKTAILQGFSAFPELEILIKKERKSDDFRPVFYDIETTGLSRFSTFLYLIGAVRYDGKTWILHQWLAEDEKEESLILNAFFDFLQECNGTVQYNGNHFDKPYLETRSKYHGIDCPLGRIPSLDLYQEIKSMASFFKLSSMKQPIVEKFYGIPERQFFSGKECIHIYKQFQKTKDSSLSALLFGHNQEDLSGLIQLTSLLSYRSLYDGIFHLADSYYEGGEYIATITLPFFLPVPVSNGNKYFYLTCQERKARILIPAVKDKLRFYHADYKKYAYLPEEDTVIPKSLSKFLDRSLFLSATPETCYTWVSCEDLFLSDALKQEQFIKQQLPILLSFL